MKCKKPFWKGGVPHGCNQCLQCRVNRRRVWTNRLMFEQEDFDCASFVTLTYSDEFLPKNSSLVPHHVRDFIQRLRRDFPRSLRYYYCGEYGDGKGERKINPHYHIALFGYPHCQIYPQVRTPLEQKNRRSCGCPPCALIRKKWNMVTKKSRTGGFTDVGTLTKDSIQYISNYVTKISKEDKKLIKTSGRYPVFARMSQGLGKNVVNSIVFSLLNANSIDIPFQVRRDGKFWPLGRYLRGKVADALLTEEEADLVKGKAIRAQETLLQEMLKKDAVKDPFFGSELSLRRSYDRVTLQNHLNFEAKFNIFRKKENL